MIQNERPKRKFPHGKMVSMAALVFSLIGVAGCNTANQPEDKISSKPGVASLGQYAGLKAFKAICLIWEIGLFAAEY